MAIRISIMLTLFFIALILSSNAQSNSIKGRVYDKDSENREAIPYASIEVLRNDSMLLLTTSDKEGNYELKPLKAGKYKIKVSSIGYEAMQLQDVFVASNKVTFLDISMSAAIELKDIEVIDYSKPAFSIDNVTMGGTITFVEEKAMFAGGVSSASKTEGKGKQKLSSKTSPAKEASSMEVGVAKFDVDYSLSAVSIVDETSNLSSSTSYSIKAGTLTAGEVNDFTKWSLWTDMTAPTLKVWQDHWQIKPVERYSVQLTTMEGVAIIDANVQLVSSSGKIRWQAKTDNTGKAELWNDMFDGESTNENLFISVNYKGKVHTAKQLKTFNDGINVVKIPASCEIPTKADIAFVVDATSSMNDEIKYLQSELNHIISYTKEKNQIELRTGSVFYRDVTDAYITQKSDFSSDINQTINFINSQSSDGGGDLPEAVDKALEVAIGELNWSDEAISRILVLVLDAPPHSDSIAKKSIQKSIELAAAKGIRIIPIVASGADKSTEYLMRSFALATNGTYTFLTDHSGIGYSHIKPTTDQYNVVLLNDLLKRIFYEFLYTSSCNTQYITDKEIRDTMYLFNPIIIDKVIMDSTILSKQTKALLLAKDSSTIAIADTATKLQDTLANSTENQERKPEVFKSLKYYPNPTSHTLYIEIEGNASELFLCDISGKIVQRFTSQNQTKVEIDVTNFSSGIYYLKYHHLDTWLDGKVIITH